MQIEFERPITLLGPSSTIVRLRQGGTPIWEVEPGQTGQGRHHSPWLVRLWVTQELPPDSPAFHEVLARAMLYAAACISRDDHAVTRDSPPDTVPDLAGELVRTALPMLAEGWTTGRDQSTTTWRGPRARGEPTCLKPGHFRRS